MEYIYRLKTERAAAAFSETLPVPARVVVSEISNMRLSWSGIHHVFRKIESGEHVRLRPNRSV